jgi:hypothetical protein
MCHGAYSSKETVRLTLNPGSEEEVVLSSGESSVAECQPPKPFDSDGRPVAPQHLAEECIRNGIKRINTAITKIADKQVVAQGSEIGGGKSDTPGGIQRASGSEGLNEVPVEVENVYEACA